jgi:poly-gamma-glutamate synthesis protein (capsule biosynthesis protein)
VELIPQKIALAQTLSDLVIISVHWGYELRDWPDQDMVESGRWFIDLGADMVAGHHPHVIIPPSVYKNRPIFYSLGNFIFDQKYKPSKQGLIAACRIQGNRVSFEVQTISTPFNSSFPQSIASDDTYSQDLKQAEFQLNKNELKFHDLTVTLDKTKNSGEAIISIVKKKNIRWQSPPLPVLSAFKTRLRPDLDEEILILLLRMYSPLDKETAPRVYVYSVTEHGLKALWRGSALAWPLVDAFLAESESIDYLCALHRGDSFLVLDPATSERKLAYYLWNGFGFNLKEEVPIAVKTAAQKRWRTIDQ